MFKTTIAAAAAAVAFAPAAALAGPYVNVEANASWAGDDYTGATTDIHVGYEGTVGAAGYYVQAGPAIVAADGAENSSRISGKAGIGVPVTVCAECLSLIHISEPTDQRGSRMPSSA